MSCLRTCWYACIYIYVYAYTYSTLMCSLSLLSLHDICTCHMNYSSIKPQWVSHFVRFIRHMQPNAITYFKMESLCNHKVGTLDQIRYLLSVSRFSYIYIYILYICRAKPVAPCVVKGMIPYYTFSNVAHFQNGCVFRNANAFSLTHVYYLRVSFRYLYRLKSKWYGILQNITGFLKITNQRAHIQNYINS